MTKRGPNTVNERLAVRRNAWKRGIGFEAVVIATSTAWRTKQMLGDRKRLILY